jgi:hypothetical protein
MHPWMMEQLALERRIELSGASVRSWSPRRTNPGGVSEARGTNRRVTRYFGELLIRTGSRLLGPEAPASGVRSRLALPGPAQVRMDSC